MLDMSPIERARALAQQQNKNSGSLNFFSPKDGETVVLRFLTGIEDIVVYSHSCGVNHVECLKREWEEAKSAGRQMTCIQCGQPISESDVLYERHGLYGIDAHNPEVFMNGKKSWPTFQCLERNPEHLNPDGTPKYPCPVCAAERATSKDGMPHPKFKLYGLAIEREPIIEESIQGGMKVKNITGVRDVMVTDEETGEQKPKIVIVDKSYNNFWNQLVSFSPDYSQPITQYDFSVQRVGSGKDTKYVITAVNAGNPNTVDMREYERYMPDMAGYLSFLGSPEHYQKYGYAVQGYVPKDSAQPQQAPQPAATPVQAFQSPQQHMQPQDYVPQQPSDIPPWQQGYSSQGPVGGWDVSNPGAM